MKEILAVLAVFLVIAGNVSYVRDVWRGKVQPHPFTWLVGSIVSATVFFGMLVKGAGIGALPIAASEIFTIIIFLMSVMYGVKKVDTVDYLFLVAALAGFLPWILTRDPTDSVVIAVAIDMLSLVPTLRKTWRRPSSENPLLFGSNVLRHILVLASLETYNLTTMLHSIAMICANSAIVAAYLARKERESQ